MARDQSEEGGPRTDEESWEVAREASAGYGRTSFRSEAPRRPSDIETISIAWAKISMGKEKDAMGERRKGIDGRDRHLDGEG